MTTFTNVQLILFIFRLLISSQHTSAAWCIAKDGASSDALQQGIDYACGNGADCSEIISGGKCFEPDTVQSHASYAYNSYYQRSSKTPDACDFSGTATIANADPSYGTCVYQGSASMVRGTKGKTGATSGAKKTPPSKYGHDILQRNEDN